MTQDEIKELISENEDVINILIGIQRDCSEKHERIRERALAHTYHLMTAIGLVAGFGFTAVDTVYSLERFLVGELFLLSGIAIAIWFAKAGFIDEMKYTYKWSQDIRTRVKDRIQMRYEFNNADVSTIRNKMKELKEKDLNLFKNPIVIADYKWLGIVFYIFICGGVFLLSSFVDVHIFIQTFQSYISYVTKFLM